MANKIILSGQSGLTVSAVITDRDTNKVWDGDALVTYDDSDFSDYLVAMTERGHGTYTVTVPSNLPAGNYHIAFHESVDPEESIGQSLIKWDGTDVTEDTVTGSVSVVDIYNMALGHLGVTRQISNTETDRSQANISCNTFYESTRDEVLRSAPWPFATHFADAALVEEDPTTEWAYAYRYPVNCLKLRRILSGVRNDNRQSRVPYKLGRDSSGTLVYTDAENAEYEYTFRETNPGKYPADFVLALSLALAAYIAPQVTGGDPFKLGARALELYLYKISQAQANAGNEESPEEEPESEFIRTRN